MIRAFFLVEPSVFLAIFLETILSCMPETNQFSEAGFLTSKLHSNNFISLQVIKPLLLLLQENFEKFCLNDSKSLNLFSRYLELFLLYSENVFLVKKKTKNSRFTCHGDATAKNRFANMTFVDLT